jgi:hypothetical protein
MASTLLPNPQSYGNEVGLKLIVFVQVETSNQNVFVAVYVAQQSYKNSVTNKDAEIIPARIKLGCYMPFSIVFAFH